MKPVLLVGARPNFMKLAPVLKTMDRYNRSHGSNCFDPVLVHSGQHYDYEMSKVFFEELAIPEPDFYLDVGSGTHAQQTGRVMIEFEKVLTAEKPDLAVVIGDINSTLAGAITAAKMHIPVAHIEAGVRSGDETMPEEINRQLTDVISDYLFTPSEDASDNLRKEGIDEKRIVTVGNVMVDSLFMNRPKAESSDVLNELGIENRDYALLTIHRAANVDDPAILTGIAQAVNTISETVTVVFPAHPRTQKNITEFGLQKYFESTNILSIKPQGYIRFLRLLMSARFVMTDSGGVEPETTVLGIPCLTLMETTAWKETVSLGTNVLVGTDPSRLLEEAGKVLQGTAKTGSIPPLWDGKTAERITEVLANL